VKNCGLKSINSINSVSNQEELPDQWKKSITVPVYMKGDSMHEDEKQCIWNFDRTAKRKEISRKTYI
jgi:hypothetical protein